MDCLVERLIVRKSISLNSTSNIALKLSSLNFKAMFFYVRINLDLLKT